ncbi:MAG TPA: hypothetical protein VL976_12340, partial [Xanthobacteraceae bacterium]|nr:hypothetical protein [Xanthobacteraceae bacterium]
MIGHFQFKPGSAMRKNLPKRVTTATCAVLTVKKLPKSTDSRKNTKMANKVKVTTSMGSLRIVSGDAKLPGRMNANGRDFSAHTKARDEGFTMPSAWPGAIVPAQDDAAIMLAIVSRPRMQGETMDVRAAVAFGPSKPLEVT